jgi:hypothetical protein
VIQPPMTSDECAAWVLRVERNIRTHAYSGAKQAWSAYDAVRENEGLLSAGKVGMLRWLVRREYGHRPCARVGLKTKPFYVARSKKVELRRVGRVLTGHKRISLETLRG